jgi:addiction module HigA family antidote
LDAGRVELSDVIETQAERMTPVHPGVVLRHEYLAPLGLSVYGLAAALRVSRSRMNDIVLGRRAITAETALRLDQLFGTSADFWLGLQTAYDLETARLTVGERVRTEVKPLMA